MRRYTRLSNGFSRKLENHLVAVRAELLRLQLHQDSLDPAHDACDGGRRDEAPVADLVDLLIESQKKAA
jgi:hypothetical protein